MKMKFKLDICNHEIKVKSIHIITISGECIHCPTNTASKKINRSDSLFKPVCIANYVSIFY